MTTMTKLASFSLLSLVLGVAAVADAAGASTTYRFKGKGVNANHYFSDGCSYEYVNVGASESFTRDGGGPRSSFEAAYVFIDEFDCSTGEYHSISGSGPVDLLQFTGNASNASVEATIPLQYCTYSPPDYIWNCVDTTAVVDLDAQAIAPPYRVNDRYHVTLPDGTQYTYTYSAKERDAQPSGKVTLTLDGTEFSFDTASIYAQSNGSMVISRP